MHEDQSARPSTLSAESAEAVARDVYAVSRIEILPTLLDVLCDITGMGFAAVARMSDVSWTVCAVKDKINFGLKIADQLPLESTLCMESKRTGESIVIDHVSRDPRYCSHKTLREFSIESYISVPIVLRNGRHFGNLCAVDPAPAKVSAPAITNTFQRFAALIASQVDCEAERQDDSLPELHQALLNPIRAIRDATDALGSRAMDAIAVKGLATRIRTNALEIASLLEKLRQRAPPSDPARSALMPELPPTPSTDSCAGEYHFSDRMDKAALESLLMQRVGELNSHLGRYDMYALTIQTWLIRKGHAQPLAEAATISTRGAFILRHLRLLDVNDAMIVEFEELNRQALAVLVRQEIAAKKGASIPSLQDPGMPRAHAIAVAERAWFDHIGARAEELAHFIAAMERDIAAVATLYIRLAGWAGKLEFSIK